MNDEKKANNEKLKNDLKNTFADILDDLVEDEKKKTGLGNNQIADEIGIGQGQLSKHLNAQAELKISSLVKIAKYFGVSTDYLLGLTKLKSPNEDYKTVHKVLNLSDGSIKNVKAMNKNNDGFAYVLNLLLDNTEETSKYFKSCILNIIKYLSDMSNADAEANDSYDDYNPFSIESLEKDIEEGNNPYKIKNAKELEAVHLFRITNITTALAKKIKEKYLSDIK